MTEKLPKSALCLYVKLYCKKKGDAHTKSRNNLVEATKSWLSLSEEEKQQFTNKLEECRVKFQHRFADYLKNVEPYLKKKPIKKVSKANRTENSASNFNPDQVDNRALHEDIITTDANTSCWYQTFTENNSPENLDSEMEEVFTINPLPEPIPPNAKSAIELFNIIKSVNTDKDDTWTTLSFQEKQTYRSATLSLKKDYIVKYKAYLESLPSRQLFDYYNKNMES